MTNFEYLQGIDITMFHALLCDMLIDKKISTPEIVWEWLNEEINEELCKAELIEYCSLMDRFNNLLSQNYELKKDNIYLIDEILQITEEGIRCGKILAEFKSDIINMVERYEKYNNDQIIWEDLDVEDSI